SVPADESGFVGEDDGLDAVADLEFHEDASDVGLDRRLSEEEPLSDLGVAQPLGDEHEHLPFARSQRLQAAGRGLVEQVRRRVDRCVRCRATGLGRPGVRAGRGVMPSPGTAGWSTGAEAGQQFVVEQASGRRGGDDGSPVDDGADRVEQHLGQSVLEEEPGGAAPQGVQGVLIIVEGGQDDDLRGADLPAVGEAEDLLGRFDPVDAGHAHVHEDDIGLLLADGVDAGHAIAGLTGHGHIGLGVDDHGEASAHKGLVVDEDDTQRIRRMSAHRRPPSSPLGALGPEVVVGLSTSPSTAAGPASCPAPSLSSLPSSRPSSWPRAPVSWASTASALVSWDSTLWSSASPLVSSASVPASWDSPASAPTASVPAPWDSTSRLSGNRASTRKPVAVPKALPGTLPELNAGSPPDTLAAPAALTPPEATEPPEFPEPSEESVSPVEWMARAVSVPP